jgi:hypothetical protein
MKNSANIALFSIVFCCSTIYADFLYDEMIIAIKEGNCKQIEAIAQRRSFSESEQNVFGDLANEVFEECKLARGNRRLRVQAGLALKVLTPLLGCWGLVPGACLDPRGIAGMFAILPALLSPLSLALFVVPVANYGDDRAIAAALAIVGSAASAATYGLIKLEKYFWKRAAEIDHELGLRIEKARDCKNLLVELFYHA